VEWRDAAQRSAASGYQLLEIPLRDPASVDPETLRPLLAEAGIRPICLAALAPTADISSDRSDIADAGEILLNRILDVTIALGADYLGGVLYGAATHHTAPLMPAGRWNAVRILQRLAARAGAHGVTLGLEVVNRYESNLLNTAEQAMEMITDIADSNVTIHLDTYHMNIEEESPAAAIHRCRNMLGYMHISESHRGFLGTGTVDFDAVFDALIEVGYTGPVAVEGFLVPAMPQPLAASLGLWRTSWHDPQAFARHANTFITSRLSNRGRNINYE
jgi:D-psicose/D-tagatose/L-ribulose 3-epimerase